MLTTRQIMRIIALGGHPELQMETVTPFDADNPNGVSVFWFEWKKQRDSAWFYVDGFEGKCTFFVNSPHNGFISFLHLDVSLNTKEFQTEILQGTVYIVFEPYDNKRYPRGTVNMVPANFTPWANLSAEFGVGYAIEDFDLYFKPKPSTNKPAVFEFLEGDLPCGIELMSDGMLRGELLEQDCCGAEHITVPSAGWRNVFNFSGAAFEQFSEWGLPYYFKVRACATGKSNLCDEKWLCLRVHNNWDCEQERLLRAFPYWTDKPEIKVEEKIEFSFPDFLKCGAKQKIQEKELFFTNKTELIKWWNVQKEKDISEFSKGEREFLEKLGANQDFKKMLLEYIGEDTLDSGLIILSMNEDEELELQDKSEKRWVDDVLREQSADLPLEFRFNMNAITLDFQLHTNSVMEQLQQTAQNYAARNRNAIASRAQNQRWRGTDNIRQF